MQGSVEPGSVSQFNGRNTTYLFLESLGQKEDLPRYVVRSHCVCVLVLFDYGGASRVFGYNIDVKLFLNPISNRLSGPTQKYVYVQAV